MTTFLKATLKNGDEVISRFSEVSRSGQAYARDVLSGKKPFNAWIVVAEVHPKSGEKCLIRTRKYIAPSEIASITPVQPKAGFEDSHNYAPMNFEDVKFIKEGDRGIYTVPSPSPMDDLTPGDEYPKHRDPLTFNDYIVVKVASGDAAEQRFYINGNTAGVIDAGTSESEENELDSFTDDLEDSER